MCSSALFRQKNRPDLQAHREEFAGRVEFAPGSYEHMKKMQKTAPGNPNNFVIYLNDLTAIFAGARLQATENFGS
jgi:hypothetical protein